MKAARPPDVTWGQRREEGRQARRSAWRRSRRGPLSLWSLHFPPLPQLGKASPRLCPSSGRKAGLRARWGTRKSLPSLLPPSIRASLGPVQEPLCEPWVLASFPPTLTPLSRRKRSGADLRLLLGALLAEINIRTKEARGVGVGRTRGPPGPQPQHRVSKEAVVMAAGCRMSWQQDAPSSALQERKRELEISMMRIIHWMLPTCPLLGIKPKIQGGPQQTFLHEIWRVEENSGYIGFYTCKVWSSLPIHFVADLLAHLTGRVAPRPITAPPCPGSSFSLSDSWAREERAPTSPARHPYHQIWRQWELREQDGSPATLLEPSEEIWPGPSLLRLLKPPH